MIRINLFKRVVEMLDRLENEIEMLERALRGFKRSRCRRACWDFEIVRSDWTFQVQSPLLAPNIRAGGLDQTITVRRNYEREDFRVCSELRASSRPVSQEAK